MQRSISREITVLWEATSLAITRERIEAPRCRNCGSALTLHQPDEKAPEHLLGTCGDCSDWFLIVMTRDGAEALMSNMPIVEVIRTELAPAEDESTDPASRPKRKRGASNRNGDRSAT